MSEFSSQLEQLSGRRRATLERLVEVLATKDAPSSVRAIKEIREVHIADSLAGLELAAVTSATRVADVGAGAGLPGLVLAIALPETQVDLLEANGRKCAFMERAIDACGLDNAHPHAVRAEDWATPPPPQGGREAYDLVTARAVGRLSTLAELASPLLREGGTLVAWKGRRDPEEEAELARGFERHAMRPYEVRWVGPYAGSRNRHLHVLVKGAPTPADLPRRPGIAKKRPFGAHRAAQ